jgi:hypothetical protein
MKRIFLYINSAITLFIFNSLATLSSAQTIPVTVKQKQGQGVLVSQGTASAEGIVQTILLNVITLFFAVGGIGVTIYFIWGAVDWILAGGDKEKISGARKKMTNSLIGLVLLSLSFALIRTVGSIVGFDPLGNLQLRGLGDGGSPVVPNR